MIIGNSFVNAGATFFGHSWKSRIDFFCWPKVFGYRGAIVLRRLGKNVQIANPNNRQFRDNMLVYTEVETGSPICATPRKRFDRDLIMRVVFGKENAVLRMNFLKAVDAECKKELPARVT